MLLNLLNLHDLLCWSKFIFFSYFTNISASFILYQNVLGILHICMGNRRNSLTYMRMNVITEYNVDLYARMLHRSMYKNIILHWNTFTHRNTTDINTCKLSFCVSWIVKVGNSKAAVSPYVSCFDNSCLFTIH